MTDETNAGQRPMSRRDASKQQVWLEPRLYQRVPWRRRSQLTGRRRKEPLWRRTER